MIIPPCPLTCQILAPVSSSDQSLLQHLYNMPMHHLLSCTLKPTKYWPCGTSSPIFLIEHINLTLPTNSTIMTFKAKWSISWKAPPFCGKQPPFVESNPLFRKATPLFRKTNTFLFPTLFSVQCGDSDPCKYAVQNWHLSLNPISYMLNPKSCKL